MARERLALFEFMPQPGGGQRVCALIAQTLAGDYDVHLLSPEPATRSWWETTFDVDLRNVTIGTTDRTRTLGRRSTRVNVLPDRYDVLINAEYAYWALDPTRARTRLIMAHDAHPLDRTPSYLADYHCAIACSEYGRGKLEDEQWPIAKAVLYPPIFENDPMGPPAATPRTEQGIILTVARFDHHRHNNSLPSVVAAFQTAYDAGLRDYELVIAGFVQDTALYEQLAASARGYPIRFVASPTRPELRALYRRAAFLLNVRGIDSALPTTAFSHEALGVVTIEAISHGCLPIVHGCAGHLETVPDPNLHIESLASLPQRLTEIVRRHETPAVREAAWRPLFEAARTRFSATTYVRNFKRLVERLR